jgi:hypothetical protein
MNREETIEAIIKTLTDARREGADHIHFGALATNDDVTTLGDLIDDLLALDTM